MYMPATVRWLGTWTGGVTRYHCHVQAPTKLPLVHMILFLLMMLPTPRPPLRRRWRRGISGSGWSCQASVEKLAPPGTQFLARCLGGLGLIFPFFHSFNLYVCQKKRCFLGSSSHCHGLALAAVRLDWFGLCERWKRWTKQRAELSYGEESLG